MNEPQDSEEEKRLTRILQTMHCYYYNSGAATAKDRERTTIEPASPGNSLLLNPACFIILSIFKSLPNSSLSDLSFLEDLILDKTQLIENN